MPGSTPASGPCVCAALLSRARMAWWPRAAHGKAEPTFCRGRAPRCADGSPSTSPATTRSKSYGIGPSPALLNIHERGKENRSLSKGYLDEQFCQIEDLQDESSPNFTEEVVSLFFKNSTRIMTNIEQAMENNPRDFARWDVNMQQLKGSCSSIGASRMKNECTLFRNSCGDENAEGCMRSFQNLKREHGVLRQKLESYFQLLRQASPAVTAAKPRGM